MAELLKNIGKRLRKAPLSAQFGLLVIFIYLLMALFARQLAPYPETEVVGTSFAAWGEQFYV